MTAPRQDAWTEDDDLLLAEVILRHIREGSTQLAAFEEIGRKLNRTAAACGFRWNSLVRKKYEAAIQIAKAQRQNRAYQQIEKTNKEIDISYYETDVKQDLDETITFDTVIRFLKKQKMFYQDYRKKYKNHEKEIEDKEVELESLRKENKELKDRINSIESNYKLVNDDYKALVQIMDRARKLAFLAEEEDNSSKQLFKMDLNGNLERINK